MELLPKYVHSRNIEPHAGPAPMVRVTLTFKVEDRAKVRAAALRKYVAAGNRKSDFDKWEREYLDDEVAPEEIDNMMLLTWIDLLMISEMPDDDAKSRLGFWLYNSGLEVGPDPEAHELPRPVA